MDGRRERSTEPDWILLADHPIFRNHPRSTIHPPDLIHDTNSGCSNLAAWNHVSSRLFLWDADVRCLYRLSIRFGDPDDDGAPSIEAASPSEVLLTDICIDSPVHHISLNGEGSALLLVGFGGLFVMYLFDRVSSVDDSIVCRTVSIGSEMYFGQNDGLRIVQVSWHPYSRTHLGILSSDTVFRLYDLTSDLKRPEQEYYLQAIESGRYGNVASNCPVAFSFGGEHLWDRFTVFILFNDGSIYILCPVVPFGSIFSSLCLEEIYEDANIFGLKSANTKAVSNSWFAVTWLEATFPELANKSVVRDSLPGLRARPYAPLDASLMLQGPLYKVSHAMPNGNSHLDVNFKGKAVGFLYNLIGKDSVLVIAWSCGQVQIDALADEIQPLWSVGASPGLRVDSRGRIIGIAMICESVVHETSLGSVSWPHSHELSETVWEGNPPPLLGLAIVDLALPNNALNNYTISVYPDPVVPERIFCLHSGGIDLIVLHFLPFSHSISEIEESSKTPSVYPILGGCNGKTPSESLFCGFIAMPDSFGNSRVIGITSLYECITLEVKRWSELPQLPVDITSNYDLSSSAVVHTPELISKELLSGPKLVVYPESAAIRDLRAESIEGRSALHHYIKLFHEHYMEYAHKVYFELGQHGNHLKAILDEQHARLRDANQKLSNFETRQSGLRDRINKVVQGYMLLENRLKKFRSLLETKKKPLSKAEREFKTQLEWLKGSELDALHSSIDTLNARARRHKQSPSNSSASKRKTQGRRSNVSDVQFAQLQSSMAKLSILNNENSKKVHAIDQELKNQET